MSHSRFPALALIVALLMVVSVAAPTANAFAAGKQPVCPGPAAAGYTHCHAWILNPRASSSPTGLSPAQIKAAYGYSADMTAGAGQVIAIVDAYDDPTAERDLGVFSQQY